MFYCFSVGEQLSKPMLSYCLFWASIWHDTNHHRHPPPPPPQHRVLLQHRVCIQNNTMQYNGKTAHPVLTRYHKHNSRHRSRDWGMFFFSWMFTSRFTFITPALIIACYTGHVITELHWKTSQLCKTSFWWNYCIIVVLNTLNLFVTLT